MVEDFDDNGNIRSSLPAQFLAVIWTPEDYNLDSGRGLSTEGAARQYQVKIVVGFCLISLGRKEIVLPLRLYYHQY